MANSDSSSYTLRWNEVDQDLEYSNGLNWVNTGVAAGGGINQLTGGVTAGPGTGSQTATVVSVGGVSAANVAAAVTTANNAVPNTGGTINGQLVINNTAANTDGLTINNTTPSRGLLVNGKIKGRRDNGASLAVSGLQSPTEGAAVVSSYAGIFTDATYSDAGTLDTRFITGGNLEMDVELQSPHMLRLTAGDNSTTDASVRMSSNTNIKLMPRGENEVDAPKYLVVDRVDTSVHVVNNGNTSDVTLAANAGTLQITGALTGTASGNALTGAIGSSGLTQNSARLLGRTTASAGAVEEITVGSGLSLSAGSLTATGGSQTIPQYLTHSASSSQSDITNATPVVVGTSQAITLQKTTNSVKITTPINIFLTGGGASAAIAILQCYRDSTLLAFAYQEGAAPSTDNHVFTMPFVWFDTPGDVSAHTYSFKAFNQNTGHVYIGGGTEFIYLEEILS